MQQFDYFQSLFVFLALLNYFSPLSFACWSDAANSIKKKTHGNPFRMSIVLTPRHALPFYLLLLFFFLPHNNETCCRFYHFGQVSFAHMRLIYCTDKSLHCTYALFALSNASKSSSWMRFMKIIWHHIFLNSGFEIKGRKNRGKKHSHNHIAKWTKLSAACSSWLCTIANGCNKVTEFIIAACLASEIHTINCFHAY